MARPIVDPGPEMPDRPGLALRLALALVGRAGRLVPATLRRGWKAEWHAELLTRDARLRDRGGPAGADGLRTVVIGLGAVRDAWELTTHGFRIANLFQDARRAVRSLAKRPSFTVTAVLTLAIGIGATTALFTVLRGVLLRPFPYQEPDRLVQLMGSRVGDPPGSGNVSYPNLDDIEREGGALAGVAGLSAWRPALTGDEPEVVPGATVSWDYFALLGLTPVAGRFFQADDEGEGREPAVVISHGLWTRRFGADPTLPGRTIQVNNESYLVVGVAPRGFEGPHLVTFGGEQPEIWRTPWFEAAEWFRSGRSWRGVARLADGVTMATAQEDVSRIMQRLTEAFPEENADRLITLRPLRDSVVADSRPALMMLLAAVALVLLVACVNVANLFLGRILERFDDLRLQAALGASRGRLLAHLLSESLVIAVVGGLAGVGLAFLGIRGLVGLAGTSMPRVDAIRIDGVVLSFAAAVTIGTGLLFGLIPSLRMLGGRSLASGAGARDGGSLSRHAGRLRSGLVLAQVATTVMLVFGAVLLVRSFLELDRVDLGLETHGVLTLDMHGAAWWDLEPEAAAIAYRTLIERVEALPGVSAVGAMDVLPLAGSYSCDGFTPLDRPPPAPGEGECAEVRSVTPGALEALGVRLVSGRPLAWSDGGDAARSAIVSRRTAGHFWPSEDAIGKRALVHGDSFTIVGVVADVRHFGPEREAAAMMFLPSAQEPWNGIARGLSLVVSGEPAVERMGEQIEREIHAVNPAIAVENVRPLGALLRATTGAPRFRTTLLVAFAGAALALALVGIVGVITNAVTRRRRELGIRIALGATPAELVRSVSREGAAIAVAGLAIGVLGALALSRVLRAFVFGVSVLDPAALVAGAALVLGLSLLATWLPARRAARIDPNSALRDGGG